MQRTFMLAWMFAVLGDLVPIVMDNVWGFAAAYGLEAVVYVLGFVLNSRGKVVSVQSERNS
ncbi:MAG: hypothetical protein ACQEXV_19885 [Bacillota bacterium]